MNRVCTYLVAFSLLPAFASAQTTAQTTTFTVQFPGDPNGPPQGPPRDNGQSVKPGTATLRGHVLAAGRSAIAQGPGADHRR